MLVDKVAHLSTLSTTQLFSISKCSYEFQVGTRPFFYFFFLTVLTESVTAFVVHTVLFDLLRNTAAFAFYRMQEPYKKDWHVWYNNFFW